MLEMVQKLIWAMYSGISETITQTPWSVLLLLFVTTIASTLLFVRVSSEYKLYSNAYHNVM